MSVQVPAGRCLRVAGCRGSGLCGGRLAVRVRAPCGSMSREDQGHQRTPVHPCCTGYYRFSKLFVASQTDSLWFVYYSAESTAQLQHAPSRRKRHKYHGRTPPYQDPRQSGGETYVRVCPSTCTHIPQHMLVPASSG
ncbi:hypothetical protein FKM82_006349 [Ascaphus truei]